MGAFLTLSVYGFIVFNTITLWTAFRDNSKQSEFIQTNQFDRWFSDAINLTSHDIWLSMYVEPAMPASYGTFVVTQTMNCKSDHTRDCP